MIESPTDNVKLTFDQLQAIDASKKMLANLESEIINAQKVLKGTKMECDRAVNDFSYREKLLVDINSRIEIANKALEDLQKQTLDARIVLEGCQKEAKLINETNVVTEQSLRVRENKLSLAEQEHQTKVGEHDIKSNELSKQRNIVDTAKSAFLKAVESVQW